MLTVTVEVSGSPAGPWHEGPLPLPEEACGSISTDDPAGIRQVYLFGWLNDGTRPGVWHSLAGVDLETGALRVVSSAELVRVADLTEAPHVMERRGSLGDPMWLRFALAEVEL
jgi:hypothetical protein